MNDPFVLGLTGPSCSGKGEVSAVLHQSGFAVIDCDAAARAVTKPGSDLLPILADEFGADIIREDGSLNRQLLANRAFASVESTEKLNKLTHPKIIEECRRRISESALNGYSVVVLDAPTLFESGADALCELIVCVTAPAEVRLDRMIARDNITAEEARLRMSAQQADEYYISKSNYHIENSGDLSALIARSADLAETVREAADGVRQN